MIVCLVRLRFDVPVETNEIVVSAVRLMLERGRYVGHPPVVLIGAIIRVSRTSTVLIVGGLFCFSLKMTGFHSRPYCRGDRCQVLPQAG